MKRCPKCGGFYPDDMKTCSECGTSLVSKENYTQASYELKNIEHENSYLKKSHQILVKPLGKNGCLNLSQSKLQPKCPICGSTNLTKLSTVGKIAKIAAFGIFGMGDNGKTYKCNSCGAKF